MALILVIALLKLGRQAILKHINDIARHAVQLLGQAFDFAGNAVAFRRFLGLRLARAFDCSVTPRGRGSLVFQPLHGFFQGA